MTSWRVLFKYAGYTVDGKPAERPPEPLELWRGSVPERCTDWSWTDNRDVAQWYANGYRRRPQGTVWQATVEPWRLLARNTERNEGEYVVDTDGLVLVEGR
jgi:hypothetical protein